MNSNDTRDFLTRWGACFLVLWTPFQSFSAFRGYPVSPTALVYAALLVGMVALAIAFLVGPHRGVRRAIVLAALVSLFLNLEVGWFDDTIAYAGLVLVGIAFWLIREHVAMIVLVVFATVLLTSMLGSSGRPYVEQTVITTPSADSGPSGAKGWLVHVILDEFAGPAGIPDDVEGGPALRAEIEAFFRDYGFDLYPQAFGEYAATRASVSGILNFESSSEPERNFAGKRHYVMEHNAYFEDLHARGYDLHVLQSTYMDYCVDSPVPIADCSTYRYDGTDWLRDADLSDLESLSVLFGMLLDQSKFFEAGWKIYVKLRDASAGTAFALPVLQAWDGHVNPVAAKLALERFRDEVVASRPGTAHFAHILLPHSPYMYDGECHLIPGSRGWLSAHPLNEHGNTRAGREERYELYFGQVRCALRELRSLFDAIHAAGRWDETEIIVHGDHGSRIFEVAPHSRNRERLTAESLADAYDTLFAVKSPRAPAIARDSVVPVSRLLALMAGAEYAGGSVDAPIVYLEGEDDGPWVPVPLVGRSQGASIPGPGPRAARPRATGAR